MSEIDRQELYRQLVEENSDALVVSDCNGNITVWNRAAERMFGFSEAEALGASLDLFIPENLRARHWEGYYQVMESGVTRYATQMLSAPALCKDGRRISTEFSMTIVRDAEGKVAGTAAVMRDVTERWQKEKALRARLAELEKQGAAPAADGSDRSV
ncbi:PAS domain-containing protein [Geomesophilobacter sediminis]|uniref:PAS domain S-box protein n=1 Tax=Geomesophilobacter sediminis TaxID=2798584 RepID=A0A8J7M186_9BACT|nr:PAS domain S-box protein [Geomesophilobacter sediminis]MBJ6726639.1 PAS domain S-box protein [Geomesophilobacter sediminis]